MLHSLHSSTNEKIGFNMSSTTPWINQCISKKFSLGGGWGLGWASKQVVLTSIYSKSTFLKAASSAFEGKGKFGVIELA